MGFSVEVLKNRQPVKRASVKILYNNGQDNGTTDEDGIFDTGGSGGTVKEIIVSGSTAYRSGGRDFGYNDMKSVDIG